MIDNDREAVEELALDMQWVEAVKFMRAESGLTLVESGQWAERLARGHPESKLAQSYAAFASRNQGFVKPVL